MEFAAVTVVDASASPAGRAPAEIVQMPAVGEVSAAVYAAPMDALLRVAGVSPAAEALDAEAIARPAIASIVESPNAKFLEIVERIER
jgi:hypothetical protein